MSTTTGGGVMADETGTQSDNNSGEVSGASNNVASSGHDNAPITQTVSHPSNRICLAEYNTGKSGNDAAPPKTRQSTGCCLSDRVTSNWFGLTLTYPLEKVTGPGELNPGDVVAFPRLFWWHYATVVDEKTARDKHHNEYHVSTGVEDEVKTGQAHCQGCNRNEDCCACGIEIRLSHVSWESEPVWYKVIHEAEPRKEESNTIEGLHEAVAKDLHESQYCFCSNNCECAGTRFKTGRNASSQGEAFYLICLGNARLIVLIIGTLIRFLIYGLANLRLLNDSDPCKKNQEQLKQNRGCETNNHILHHLWPATLVIFIEFIVFFIDYRKTVKRYYMGFLKSHEFKQILCIRIIIAVMASIGGIFCGIFFEELLYDNKLGSGWTVRSRAILVFFTPVVGGIVFLCLGLLIGCFIRSCDWEGKNCCKNCKNCCNINCFRSEDTHPGCTCEGTIGINTTDSV